MQIKFLEYGLPKKTMSDADGNFISDKFKRVCQNLNIEQAVSSSYPSPEQCTDRSMQQIHEVHNQKVHWY